MLGFVLIGFATALLTESLAECQQSIGEHLPEMSDFVTADVISQCSVTLKLVNDIPRLYRRTNREVRLIILIIDELKTTCFLIRNLPLS